MLRPRLIGIAGFARSGKDTAAKILQQKIKERWDIDMKIVSFAKALKQDCDPFLQKHLGISAFSEIPLEKEIIRPILVAYGQSMKKDLATLYGSTKLFPPPPRAALYQMLGSP